MIPALARTKRGDSMKRARLAGSIGAVVVIASVLAATLSAAGASSRTITGVVLGKSAAKHTIAVSSTAGAVRTVHVRGSSVRVGSKVDVVVKRLRDGTFRALRLSTHGRSGIARIHGALVVRQRHGNLLVRAGGSTLSIRLARTTAGVGGPALRPGSILDATVTITSAGFLNLASINRVQSPAITKPSGPTGTSGPTGPTGDEGDDDQGEDEDCGATGPTGPTGTGGPSATDDDDQGEDEDCGATGPTGPTGDQGDDEGDDDQGDDDSG
jgi:hypothetical protein